ncbi:hypothetical protein BH11ACT8_BH11ACT8_35070 [soil metagenome]
MKPAPQLLRTTWDRFLAAHGPRHLLDAAVPLAGYLVGYVLGGPATGAVAAVVAALVVAVARRMHGDPVRMVVTATVVVILCAGLAARTGEGRSFFVLELAANLGALLLCAASLAVHRPVTGSLARRAGLETRGWRTDPARYAVHRKVTLLWLGLWALHVVVLVPLYAFDQVVVLAVVSAVVMKP